MNTIDQLYKKYFSKSFNKKQQQKVLASKHCLDKYYKGQQLTNFESKIVLDCLRRHNMIEITKEMKGIEKRFYVSNFVGMLVGGICMISPYGIREFRNVNRYMKVMVCSLLYVLGYGGTVYPYYRKIVESNRELVRQNIWKIGELKTVHPDSK